MNARAPEDGPITLSNASKAHRGWKRITVTFTVDVLAFVFFVLLVATGLLMRYALPPGSGSLHGMGGPSAERPITLIWELTRHEWGDLHFYVAVALMGILALHLFQHWRWIAARVRGQSGRGSGWRAALGIVGLVAILGIAAAVQQNRGITLTEPSLDLLRRDGSDLEVVSTMRKRSFNLARRSIDRNPGCLGVPGARVVSLKHILHPICGAELEVL